MTVSALGQAAYFWKKPQILPLELSSSKTLVDFTSLAKEPSCILLSSPLLPPPLSPAKLWDSEKVCFSKGEVPAESGDMWHALG